MNSLAHWSAALAGISAILWFASALVTVPIEAFFMKSMDENLDVSGDLKSITWKLKKQGWLNGSAAIATGIAVVLQLLDR